MSIKVWQVELPSEFVLIHPNPFPIHVRRVPSHDLTPFPISPDPIVRLRGLELRRDKETWCRKSDDQRSKENAH